MWFGTNPMPNICGECVESWHKNLPSDWSFQFWNEDNYDVETKNNFVLQAYRSGNYAFVSDYARWDILHRQGGVYVDTDVFLLKDITPLLQNKAFAGLNNAGLFASGLILGAEPNMPIFAEMKAETQLEKDIIHLKQMALDIKPYSNWWRCGYLGSLRRAIKLMEGKL